jgi:hypothetical protein
MAPDSLVIGFWLAFALGLEIPSGPVSPFPTISTLAFYWRVARKALAAWARFDERRAAAMVGYDQEREITWCGAMRHPPDNRELGGA